MLSGNYNKVIIIYLSLKLYNNKTLNNNYVAK